MDDVDGIPKVQLSDKAVETLGQGIGAFFRPWLIRRDAIARAEARRITLLKLEQTKKDVADLRSGKKVLNDENVLVLNEHQKADLPEIVDSSKFLQGMVKISELENKLQQIEKTTNLAKIAVFVNEEAENTDEEVSSKNIDFDWLSRWRDKAQITTLEELQKLWAKIFVEENRKPGKYSFHTLELLSRLSWKDAEIIAKIAPLSLNRSLPIWERLRNIYEAKGLAFDDLLHLENIGILQGVSGAGSLVEIYDLEKDGKSIVFRQNRRRSEYGLQVIYNTKSLSIEGYSVSQSGVEIFSLVPGEASIDELYNLGLYVMDVPLIDETLNVVVNVVEFAGRNEHITKTVRQVEPPNILE